MRSQPKPLDAKAIFPDDAIILDGEKLRLWLQDKNHLDPNILTALRVRLNDALKLKEIKEDTHQTQIMLLDNQLLGIAAFTAVPERKVKESDYEAIYGGKTVLRVFPRKVLDEKKFAEQQDEKIKTNRLHKIEAFQKQFYELLDQLDRWGGSQYKDQIAWLKENMFKELYSGSQSNDYFVLVKTYFEKIYLLLNNKDLSPDIAKQVYTDLFSQINGVCSPGLPGHIETALNRLESYLNISMERWLAECRTNAIKYYAMKWNAENYKDQANMRVGYDVHTEAGFLGYARTKGWNPLSDPVREQDQYVIKLSEEKYRPFLAQIDEDYNPSDASNFIHGKLDELVKMQMAVQELKEDQDHWVPYKLKFYKALEDYTQSLLGKDAEVSQLFALDEKGRINAKPNEEYLYQKIMENCRAKHIFLDTLDKHIVKIGKRFVLKKHYFPLPRNASVERDKTNRWTGLSDDYLVEFTNHAVKECEEAKTKFPLEFADHLIESAMFAGKTKAFQCLLDHRITSHDKKSEIVNINNKPYFMHYFLGLEEVMKNWDRLSDEDALGVFEHLKVRSRESKEWPSFKYVEVMADCCARTNKPKLFNRLAQEKSDLLNIMYILGFIAQAIKHGSVTIAKQMIDRVDIYKLLGIRFAELVIEANQPDILRHFSSRAKGVNVFHGFAAEAAKKDRVEMVESIVESIKTIRDQEDRRRELGKAIGEWIISDKPRFLEKLADMKIDIKAINYDEVVRHPKSVQVLVERNMVSEQQIYQLIRIAFERNADQTLDGVFAAMKQIDPTYIKPLIKERRDLITWGQARALLKYKNKMKVGGREQKDSSEESLTEYLAAQVFGEWFRSKTWKIFFDMEISFSENTESSISSNIMATIAEHFKTHYTEEMLDLFYKFVKNEKNINLINKYNKFSLLDDFIFQDLSGDMASFAHYCNLIRMLIRSSYHGIDSVIRAKTKETALKVQVNKQFMLLLDGHALTHAAFFPAEYEYKIMPDGSRQYAIGALDVELARIRTQLIDEQSLSHFPADDQLPLALKYRAYQMGWNPQTCDFSQLNHAVLSYISGQELHKYMYRLETTYTPTYIIEKMIEHLKAFIMAEAKAGENEEVVKKKLEVKLRNDYRMVIDKDKLFTKLNDAKDAKESKSIEIDENYLHQAMLTNLCKMNIFDEKSIQENSITINNQVYLLRDLALDGDNEHRWKKLPEQVAAIVMDKLLENLSIFAVQDLANEAIQAESVTKLKWLINYMIHYQIRGGSFTEWLVQARHKVNFCTAKENYSPLAVSSMIKMLKDAKLEFSVFDSLSVEDDKASVSLPSYVFSRARFFYKNLIDTQNEKMAEDIDKVVTLIKSGCQKKSYARNLDMKYTIMEPYGSTVAEHLLNNKTPDDSFEKIIYRLIKEGKEIKNNELELLYLLLSTAAELPMAWAKGKLEKLRINHFHFLFLEQLVKYRDVNPYLNKEAKKMEYEKQLSRAERLSGIARNLIWSARDKEIMQAKFKKLIAFDELEKSIGAIVMQYPSKSCAEIFAEVKATLAKTHEPGGPFYELPAGWFDDAVSLIKDARKYLDKIADEKEVRDVLNTVIPRSVATRDLP